MPPCFPLAGWEVTLRRRGGTVEYIVEDMTEALRTGRLSPGQRLVESDLIRMLGVSRGSLREALNRLSAAGLVEIVPNRGAVVRVLTRRQVADRFEIRMCLEGLAAELAAQNLDEDDNRTRLIETLNTLSDEPNPSVERSRRDNYVLHGAIAELSGNSALIPMIRRLWLPLVMARMRDALGSEFWRESREDHHRIVEAILARDAAGAAAAMRAHLAERCKVILALPSEVFGE